jgi:hypothetical protein
MMPRSIAAIAAVDKAKTSANPAIDRFTNTVLLHK